MTKTNHEDSIKEIVILNKKHGVSKALIDAEDEHKVSGFKWYLDKDGYAITQRRRSVKNINGAQLKMHHAIMGPPSRGMVVDHIDRDRLNNKKENLRFVSHSESQWNRDKQKNNTSGFIGVSWNKRSKKFVAYAAKHGVRHHAGCFDTAEEAAIARDKLVLKLHGAAYAQLNFPERLGEYLAEDQ